MTTTPDRKGPPMTDYTPPLGEFQPPDHEEDIDSKWDRWFEQQERCGYAVISREEWRKKLDEAARDGYAEGRIDEVEQIAKDLLPGTYYMDPPDGGSVTLHEQLERMAEDARKWREQAERTRLAIECEMRCEG